jgi:signal transduction histidine kinase
MKRGPSIRYLLLIGNAFILVLPVFAVIFLNLWDGHLVRVTEQELISESVLIAEAWRDHLAEAGAAVSNDVRRIRPAHVQDERFIPIDPVLDLHYTLLPPAPPPRRVAEVRDAAEWRAGVGIQPLLERAKLTNMSAARILDPHGCIVASTGKDVGACVDDLPEVQAALTGTYAAVARQRVLSGGPPPLSSRSRRGSVRVFTATPVWSDGRVIGVIYMSRTSSSPLEAVWTLRYTVLVALLGCLLLMTAVSLFFSRAISRPVQSITAAAEAIARGEPAQRFSSTRLAPAEVDAMRSALDRMTAQLTDRATYISEFAANLSHELKTPLTGMRGAVELLRDEWADMPEVQRRRFLENIDADVTRLQHLVMRLLQLARIQSAPEAAEPVEVEPFFTRLAERYDGQVRVETDGAPATIVISRDHLETAVRNLLDNAVRHGAGKPVDVTLRAAHGRLAISVRDRGAGISEGNRARVFDRFFTTERDHGGTGLGLSIVQAVAETRGGSVTFDTGPEGTTFMLTV